MGPILLTLLFLTSCSNEKHESKDNAAIDLTKLQEVGDLYCELSKKDYEKNGYVHSKCDGSGFTSLYSLRCPDVDLQAFSESGKLYRSQTKDCLPNAESKSESSRDMVLMRSIAAWHHKDIGWLSEFLDFVTDNNYQFCDHDGSLDGRSRCIMPPRLYRLLVDMKAKLTGVSLSTTNIDLLPEKVGFTAHIEVLRIWLEGQVYGEISDSDLSELKYQSERSPDNCVFQAAYHRYLDGDMSEAMRILAAFPKDRLPSTEDYCTEYKWQRDPGEDWEPCEPFEEHSGTDFNTCLHMIEAT